MAIKIGTDATSLETNRNLVKAQDDVAKNLNRLSSGYRINDAADDAAGLAIAAQLATQVQGDNTAQQNIADGLSLAQTADGGLSSVNASLQQLRTLAVEGANETLSASDRADLNAQFQQITAGIDQVASTTSENGQNLLDQNGNTISVQSGANPNDQIAFTLNSASAANLGISSLNLNDASSAQNALSAIDGALSTIDAQRADVGAAANRLSAQSDTLAISAENQAAAQSHIQDLDVAQATSQLALEQIRTQASIAVQAQSNHAHRIPLDLLK